MIMDTYLTEFQTAYSQLLFSSRVEPNYCSDVPDAKINLAKSIQMLCLSSQEVCWVVLIRFMMHEKKNDMPS